MTLGQHLLACTSAIAAKYVEHNPMQASDLPELIGAVYGGLHSIAQLSAPPPAHSAVKALATAPPKPVASVGKPTAAQIRKSVTPSALVSFEDGKPYRMLRRHLATRGLSPEAYRAKWGLPEAYPMVASNLSAMRSAIARASGLGQQVSTRTTAPKRGKGRSAAEPVRMPKARAK